MQSQLIPPPNVLQFPILRPPIYRPLVCHFDHVHVASALHPFFTLAPNRETFPKDVAHLHNRGTPEMEEMVRSHTIVIGYGLHRVFHDFYPAPWLCVLVCLREEEIPVWYAAEELADVYEVEVVGREGPF